jgi:uncharacterized protein (DUF433 family)
MIRYHPEVQLDIRKPYLLFYYLLLVQKNFLNSVNNFDGQRKMEAEKDLLDRITANPEIFGGKPIIRGMRISVELILSLLAQGATVDSILSDYPDLEPEDIRACLAYAHAIIAHDKLDAVRVVGS